MRYLFFLTIIVNSFCFLSQRKVEWTFSYNEADKVLEMKANLQEGWHLYSQHVANDIGPVPTSFSFVPNDSIKLIGKVDEPKPVQEYDENFEALLDYFEKEVVFTQRVLVKETTVLQGSVTFMACNSTMCLPPVEEKFTIELTNE